MTAVAEVTAAAASRPAPVQRRKRVRPARVVLHVFLAVTALVWLVPLVWAVYTSLRTFADTSAHGYFSLASSLTFENYENAWEQAGLPQYFLNSVIITVPAVLVTLLFSASVAFFVSRFNFKVNLFLLMLFTAGNLLPPQVIITPLFRMYLLIPLPDWLSNGSGLMYNSFLGVILIHVAFQSGFCTFVLSNYMKTIPHELTEAALVDGASVFRQFWQIILPLCRPAFAALATLLTIWIYNDFFWGLVLFETGADRPITSAIASLQGQYFSNQNLIAAGALMTAIPTLVIYLALQRQFVSGLTLGANKG
ncbi:carbohydrate ABC transporter permease [Kutzneria buriramensis]|uniref:Multiple sugar transport system permease protein n=1 Tax=Kutzneria buriramensis TaxID=1045776 RepID=A0A3E0HBE6_9PSEU|nr:carbohydrate ABC transporter permease [Kutzneria buriramensis]REH41734.1 multiple sugar transport system permease protein [Kutzneria buriramensis]